MKRLMRILVFTAGVILLLQWTERRVAAQLGTSDGACCAMASTQDSYDLPCGYCTLGPYGGWDGGECGYGALGDSIAGDCDPDASGGYSRFNLGSENCEQSSNGCSSGPWGSDSCPTTFTVTGWDTDPANCTDLPPGCGTPGMSCSPSNPCCSAYTCISGTCQSCSAYYGQACTGACGTASTLACDGRTCPDPQACSSDANCAEGMGCVNGCCTYDWDGGHGGGGGGGEGECAGDGSGCGCDEQGDACSDDSDCDDSANLYCDTDSCTCQPDNQEDPIIIDLSGAGFRLTSLQNGVKFEFFGKRPPLQMAWTIPGANEGWLALDRNADGQIDNGSELFSNVAPQPHPGPRLGFRALAVYDQPANGGNGDGVIDQRDAVFPKLLVWVDRNHNGVSESNELLTMRQAGIQAISLNYTLSSWVDSFGNQFRYQSRITFGSGGPAGDQFVYDALLNTAK